MVKVISLSNAAYAEMKSLKENDESFSDVVLKLVEKVRKRPLTEFIGKWPGGSEELSKIRKSLTKDRSKFKTRSTHVLS